MHVIYSGVICCTISYTDSTGSEWALRNISTPVGVSTDLRISSSASRLLQMVRMRHRSESLVAWIRYDRSNPASMWLAPFRNACSNAGQFSFKTRASNIVITISLFSKQVRSRKVYLVFFISPFAKLLRQIIPCMNRYCINSQ